jgi:cysteine desulfurase
MSQARTYLDWNATAPLRPQAHAAMLAALDVTGNPSSPHAEGRRARKLMEDAREQVAALVSASPADVVFTSGGTEANNAVLTGGWREIHLAGIEHDSVLAPARRSGAKLIDLPVDADGVVKAPAFAAGGSKLLSLQIANNETGVLQPVAEIAAAARAHGNAVHTDAVQAVGRTPINFRALGVDFLTLSAHKLGGPKGIGALVVRDSASLPALIAGGGQERRRRAGTENVAAIAGFGAAAAAAASAGVADAARIAALRDALERELVSISPSAVVIGAGAPRLPNTTNVAVPGTSAETLVIALDLAGIAVSAGAACSSGKVGTSHVLQAMGVAPALARAAIRISLGWETTGENIAAFLQAWTQIMNRTRERAVA